MEFDKDFELGDDLMTIAEETIAGIIAGDIIPIPETMDEDAMSEEEASEEASAEEGED